MISELTNQNLIENRRSPQGLDSFWRVLSISPEQEEVHSSLVYGTCNNISSQPIKTDSASNETVTKIAPDLRTPEINESIRSKTEQHNNKETQIDFPEICHGFSSINKEEIRSEYLSIEVDLSALKSHVKCELSDMMRKMELLINGASSGYLCQSCENLKGNLSFLQKELLAKNKFMKSLLETQTATLNSLSNSTLKPVSLSSSLNCSVQNEEDIENKADKVKHKISQSEQMHEKNTSKLYIGNLNPSIKEIDLVELFELNTTKYLRETCSLNLPMNDKTGQSKGYAFASALKHACDELLQNMCVTSYSN